MRYIEGSVVLELDEGKCSGCGRCDDVCPHSVFSMKNGKAEIADKGLCMGCGACARNCITGALKSERGVGCAAAILSGFIKGGSPECGCGKGSCC